MSEPLSSEPKPLHTPGPWYSTESDKSWIVAPCEGDSTVIAQVGTTARNGTLSRARVSGHNARLIAAAPTMLDTLEKVRDSMRDMAITLRMLGRVISADSCDVIRDAVEATIAVAKGEG
jgi:hypothetical protein